MRKILHIFNWWHWSLISQLNKEDNQFNYLKGCLKYLQIYNQKRYHQVIEILKIKMFHGKDQSQESYQLHHKEDPKWCQ
jgi:hypothetical protein